MVEESQNSVIQIYRGASKFNFIDVVVLLQSQSLHLGSKTLSGEYLFKIFGWLEGIDAPLHQQLIQNWQSRFMMRIRFDVNLIVVLLDEFY